jgi:hypothetical protein
MLQVIQNVINKYIENDINIIKEMFTPRAYLSYLLKLNFFNYYEIITQFLEIRLLDKQFVPK